MKPCEFESKNICNNKAFSVRKNDMAFGRQKSLCIAEVWGAAIRGKPTKRAVLLSENAYERR